MKCSRPRIQDDGGNGTMVLLCDCGGGAYNDTGKGV